VHCNEKLLFKSYPYTAYFVSHPYTSARVNIQNNKKISNKKYFTCEVIEECTFCKHCGSPGCSEASFPCERARATDPPGHSCIAYIRMQKRAIIISKHVYSITERAREAAPGTRTIWRALFHSPERRRINVRPRPNSRWIAHSKMYNHCR